MSNLNRRGSLSTSGIGSSGLDNVFSEESESGSTFSIYDDGLVTGLIPRIALSLSAVSKQNNHFSTWDKRDLSRTRSLPTKSENVYSANDGNDLPELEALEACYWLRAAGFPQYAQMYEDSLFPIDIAAVATDHDFLDQDSIEALFRRLQTLNNCAKLKLHPRKGDEYDSDDEELIALSSRWKLQRRNRKWSRRKRSDDNLRVAIAETPLNCSPKESRTFTLSKENDPVKKENDKTLNVNINNNGSNTALELLYLRLNERRPSLYDNLPLNNCTRNSFPKPLQIIEGGGDTEVRSPVAKRRPGSDHYSSSHSTVGDALGSSPEDQSSDEEDVSKDLERVKSLNDDAPRTEKPRVKKARWHSFQRARNPRRESALPSLKISHLSGGQLAVLRKLSLLKLTALIERYSTVHRGIGWSVPRIFKKIISPDYKGKNVFGVPLSVNVQRTGHSLPKPILSAISYLRRTALQSVGLFRRSGGKQRIHQLKSLIEEDLDVTSFDNWAFYDIADVLKIYFRELPEPLLTVKLADTFLSIHQHVPKELRLGAMQAVVLLMPDENREALQTLLLFLNDVAQQASVNQMNASNLAVCFVPAFFHLCGASEDLVGHPKRVKRTAINKAAKELTSGLDAQECITQMITDVKKLFAVPQDTMMKCKFSYIEQGKPVNLDELGRVDGYTNEDYHSYLDTCVASLLKESRLKFKNWLTYTWPEAVPSIEVSYWKVRDGYPLRLWRATTEIEADPEIVLRRIVHERHLWDEELISWDVIEQLSDNTEVFRYVTQTVLLHPPRDHVVVRTWRTDIDNGKCAIVSTSIAHPNAAVSDGVRATVLASRYLIEPIEPGRSRLTHVYRVDLRGRTPDWYNAAMPPLLANSIQRIKNSFAGDAADLETNV